MDWCNIAFSLRLVHMGDTHLNILAHYRQIIIKHRSRSTAIRVMVACVIVALDCIFGWVFIANILSIELINLLINQYQLGLNIFYTRLGCFYWPFVKKLAKFVYLKWIKADMNMSGTLSFVIEIVVLLSHFSWPDYFVKFERGKATSLESGSIKN